MKCKRTVLPLLGTAFEPGRQADTLMNLRMKNWQKLHRQKPIFFSTGRSLCENCRKISEQ